MLPFYEKLRSLIDADETYGSMSDEEVSESLNSKTVTARLHNILINKVSLYKALGFSGGLVLMATLKALSVNADPSISLQFTEILDLIKPESAGLDITLDESRAVVDSLAVRGIISAEDAAKIKSLGESVNLVIQVELGVSSINAEDIRVARAGDGTPELNEGS